MGVRDLVPMAHKELHTVTPGLVLPFAVLSQEFGSYLSGAEGFYSTPSLQPRMPNTG